MLNEIHICSRSIHRGAGQASSESHVGEAQTLQSVIVFLARFAKVAKSRNRSVTQLAVETELAAEMWNSEVQLHLTSAAATATFVVLKSCPAPE